MNIAFVIAIRQEIGIDFLKKCNKKNINGVVIYSIKNGQNNFYLIFSGVGKTNAANAISFLINKLSVDKIINIGTCGANNKKLKYKDILLIHKAKYTDVDATTFGYKIGQIPHEPLCFITSKKINKEIFNVVNKLNFKIIPNVSLGTADSFLSIKIKNNFSIHDVDAIDMEGASCLQVANKYHIECSLIKLIADNKDGNEWKVNTLSISKIISKIISEFISQ